MMRRRTDNELSRTGRRLGRHIMASVDSRSGERCNQAGYYIPPTEGKRPSDLRGGA